MLVYRNRQVYLHLFCGVGAEAYPARPAVIVEALSVPDIDARRHTPPRLCETLPDGGAEPIWRNLSGHWTTFLPIRVYRGVKGAAAGESTQVTEKEGSEVEKFYEICGDCGERVQDAAAAEMRKETSVRGFDGFSSSYWGKPGGRNTTSSVTIPARRAISCARNG